MFIRRQKGIKVVMLEDLIYKTKEVMEDVARYLEIPFEDILTIPSLNGEHIGKEFVEKLNDRP